MLLDAELATAAAWDAARAPAGRPGRRAGGGGRGGARRAGGRPQRRDEHPAPRRHRLHLGARRAPVPAPRRSLSTRTCGAQATPRSTWPGWSPRARSAAPTWTCPTRPRPTARRCGRSSRASAGTDEQGQRDAFRRLRVPRAALAAAVGPRRVGHRAARHRAGAGRGEGAPAQPRHHRLEHPHHQPVRHRRAARALGRPARCAASWSGASCSPSRARGPTPPRSRPVGCGSTAAGGSPGRRCGPPAPNCRLGLRHHPHRLVGVQARRHHDDGDRHEGRGRRPCARCARSPATRTFNEVFFDDVFVPDSDVVGEIGQGWRIARATLGNERVSIGGGGAGGAAVPGEGPVADGRGGRRRRSPSAGRLR